MTEHIDICFRCHARFSTADGHKDCPAPDIGPTRIARDEKPGQRVYWKVYGLKNFRTYIIDGGFVMQAPHTVYVESAAMGEDGILTLVKVAHF